MSQLDYWSISRQGRTFRGELYSRHIFLSRRHSRWRRRPEARRGWRKTHNRTTMVTVGEIVRRRLCKQIEFIRVHGQSIINYVSAMSRSLLNSWSSFQPTQHQVYIPTPIFHKKTAMQELQEQSHLIPVQFLPSQRQRTPQALEGLFLHFLISVTKRNLIFSLFVLNQCKYFR